MENNQISFEDAYGQLRETVAALEAGNLSLAEATRLFEEGMRLAKQCNAMLSEAELKVNTLQQEYNSVDEESARYEVVEGSDDAPMERDAPTLPSDEL